MHRRGTACSQGPIQPGWQGETIQAIAAGRGKRYRPSQVICCCGHQESEDTGALSPHVQVIQREGKGGRWTVREVHASTSEDLNPCHATALFIPWSISRPLADASRFACSDKQLLHAPTRASSRRRERWGSARKKPRASARDTNPPRTPSRSSPAPMLSTCAGSSRAPAAASRPCAGPRRRRKASFWVPPLQGLFLG